MPFKLIGCLLVVCTGTMIGFVLSGRLYKRRDFLKSFTEFISLLATNLRYSGDDIFTLVNSCAENSSLDLLLFSECDRPFDELWFERVKQLSSEIPLSITVFKIQKNKAERFRRSARKNRYRGAVKTS